MKKILKLANFHLILIICIFFTTRLFCGEPFNGCMLAAVNKRAEIKAQQYMRKDVETHLLAVRWGGGGGHVALIIRGEHRWLAWDDFFGGRELFGLNFTKNTPDAFQAAKQAFPRQKIELAWWCDEVPLK